MQLNLEHFEKKMSLIAQVFLKLLTLEDVFTQMHNRSCFWKSFRTERVKDKMKALKLQTSYVVLDCEVTWSILNLHLCSFIDVFNECFLVQLKE